jgi:hypothetical protein
MICQQQSSVRMALPTGKVEALDAVSLVCRSKQLAGFFDGGGRGGPATKLWLSRSARCRALAGTALCVSIELLLAACRA